MPLLEVGKNLSFNAAEAAFAQPGNDMVQSIVRAGKRLRRLPGTLQITAVHMVDGTVSQRPRQQAGLPFACVIERNVGMPLNAALRVPVGLAVTDD